MKNQLDLEKMKKNPYLWGSECSKAGMSIHANPFRNTKNDVPLDAYSKWEEGWKDASSSRGKSIH